MYPGDSPWQQSSHMLILSARATLGLTAHVVAVLMTQRGVQPSQTDTSVLTPRSHR
jgi:hypothetical protein